METMKLQEVHDRLVAIRPEGARCPEDCPFCSGEYAASLVSREGNHVSDKTYTENEVKALVTAAVAEAVQPLQTELEAFRSGEEAKAVEARIAEAVEAIRTDLGAQVADLTSKLDAAVIEATQAKQERDEITNLLTAEAERIAKEAELAACRDERIAKVAEVVAFPEDYVKERADKWAALDEEAFESLLADYAALSAAKGPATTTPLPAATAMTAVREVKTNGKVGSALSELIRGRQYGLDLKKAR